MAFGFEVLEMLIPAGGWSISGDDYEGIVFEKCAPITKKQFEDGFKVVDAWKKEKAEQQAAAKEAILAKLGLTAEEVALLLA